MDETTKQAKTFDAMLDGWDLSAVMLASLGDVVAICQLEFRREGHEPQRILVTIAEESAPDFHAYLSEHALGGKAG